MGESFIVDPDDAEAREIVARIERRLNQLPKKPCAD